MILIIAGSRNLQIRMDEVEQAVQEFVNVDVVLCGECRGPDIMGKLWAQKYKLTVWSFPAPWSAWSKRAGPVRNQYMASIADGALLFWDGKSKGTGGMIEIMKKLNKTYYVVRK